MRKLFLALSLTLTLAGCQNWTAITQAYQTVTTATVPASTVIIAANAFDALKATAINYGQYCVAQKMVPTICSAANRRVVVKAVRAGTAARVQLEASITNNQPATATVYNALVAAVTALQTSSISATKGP